ncbi:MAG: DUF4861 family protein [Candidatus Cryptobacteroides sp.]
MTGIRKYAILASVLAVFLTDAGFSAFGQNVFRTDKSLFLKKDGVQIAELVSNEANRYKDVGHHGPAVENSHMALRIYFNDSGAIDVYSKSGRGMELEKYRWYPDSLAREAGAGCDEYRVGKTVGLGGIALWDGENEVKLVATRGRTARVGDTKNGSYAEMISYGVPYKGDTVDISVRVDVNNKDRIAKVTATELNGKKVQFLTGVNYHEGQRLQHGAGFISVWGVHPADISSNPVPIGAGMLFAAKEFSPVEQTSDMLRIISKPATKVATRVIAASTKEAELNTAKRFEAFMSKK